MNKKLFLILHGLTICFGIYACVVLFNARSGHPAGIIFLPIAGVIWLFVHLFLGAIQKLGTMGIRRAESMGYEPERWPPALIVVVVGCSFIFLNSASSIAPLIIYRNHAPALVALFLGIQAVNLACLCGILLRRDWGRVLAGGALLVISALLLLRVAPVLLWGPGIGFIALAYAAALIAGSSGLGYYLLTSERIRNFFVVAD